MGGSAWQTVEGLQADGALLVEDGNHGENRPRRDEFVSSGTAFIRAADMSTGRVDFEGCDRINDTALSRIRKGIGQPHDILLSHKGTVGKLARVPENAPPFVCSPQTTFWRVLKGDLLDRAYLYAFMRSQMFKAQLSSVQGETDMAPYVSLTSQRRLKIAVPDIRKQIAVGDLLSALDDKIDLNRRMAETLEAMARALFKSWFVDFDPVHARAERRPTGLPDDLAALFPDSFGKDGLPRKWALNPLERILEINPPTPLRAAISASYVDMAALPTHSARILSSVTRPAGSGARFLDGDTLIARITPCLENGKTAIVDCLGEGNTGWGSTEFIVLRPRTNIPAAWPYLLARHEQFRSTLIASMTGTSGRQRAQIAAVQNWHMATPPDVIFDAFDKFTTCVFARIKSADVESTTLMQLRDTLLPKLISGELRIADAEQRVVAA